MGWITTNCGFPRRPNGWPPALRKRSRGVGEAPPALRRRSDGEAMVLTGGDGRRPTHLEDLDRIATVVERSVPELAELFFTRPPGLSRPTRARD